MHTNTLDSSEKKKFNFTGNLLDIVEDETVTCGAVHTNVQIDCYIFWVIFISLRGAAIVIQYDMR